MRTFSSNRNGLTLIELVVVLTILVAIGGIAAATLPNMLNRTHVATVASSLPTIDASIRQNILLNSGTMGNRFDSLVTGGDEVAPYVNASGAYGVYSLAGGDIGALAGLGITELIEADPTDPAVNPDFNATFQGHQGAAIGIADGESVCVLNGPDATRILNTVWNYNPVGGAQYIVMGLGEQCSLVGANDGAFFAEAPLHAVDAATERADVAYARIMLVVELTDPGTGDAEARYIGCGAPHPDGIQGVATHLQEWYQ